MFTLSARVRGGVVLNHHTRTDLRAKAVRAKYPDVLHRYVAIAVEIIRRRHTSAARPHYFRQRGCLCVAGRRSLEIEMRVSGRRYRSREDIVAVRLQFENRIGELSTGRIGADDIGDSGVKISSAPLVAGHIHSNGLSR